MFGNRQADQAAGFATDAACHGILHRQPIRRGGAIERLPDGIPIERTIGPRQYESQGEQCEHASAKLDRH
jgi:hypothetical protein